MKLTFSILSRLSSYLEATANAFVEKNLTMTARTVVKLQV